MTCLLGGAPLSAQHPRYAAPQLHCARFLETSRSAVQTETAGGSIEASIEREAVWSFRARDSAGGVVLEAWYDSLAVRRRSAGQELVPDTDGLIGGRYRGVLSPGGAYLEQARPFVPDEVAEIADLTGAAGDLLPRLPPRALEPGESWSDSTLTLTRVPDTVVAGRTLAHFTLASSSQEREAVPRGDTLPIPLRQSTREQGDVYWSPAMGLVRRTRHLVTEATVPSGGRVRQPVRSRIEQRVELTRMSARRPCP